MRISVDGKGSWRDNASTLRFWWSVKYENVYLHACEDVRTASVGIGAYIEYYNYDRQHSSIGQLMPVAAYERNLQVAALTAPLPTSLAPGLAPLGSW